MSKEIKATLPEVTVHAAPYVFDFVKARDVTGKLDAEQSKNVGLILNECNELGVHALNHVAYILATAWHESRFKPIVEWGGDKYLKSKGYYPYYGRGFVQLTWRDNYVREGRRLGMDFIGNPDLLLRPEIAANILVNGMKVGSFTGKELSDYITPNKVDYPNARRIINGTDKMALIASYASTFAKCLE